jgi:hypothetical protein
VPGPVDKRTGLLVHPPALTGWEGFSFLDFFRESFDVPIFVDNDANMMALGELWVSRQAAEYPWDECWVVEVLGILVKVLNSTRILIGGNFATVGPTMLASIRQGVFARALSLMSRQLAAMPRC